MTAFLLVLILLAGWSLVGLAVLSIAGAETSELRVALTAPMLGTCVTALVTFLFSEVGVGVEDCAVPIAIVLVVGSIATIGLRRPRVHPAVLAVLAVSIIGLLLAARPIFTFGFGWLANGNEDMTNYVLSAQDLLKHGVLSSVNFSALAQGHDYSTVLSALHLLGGRPGTDILLAFVSRIAGRPPYQTFMPLILALNLFAASAVGALAMQIARRWWAAVLAVALVLVSPMATYGVLQELLGQVWGLGLATALFALLMRPELHSGRGASLRQMAPIGLLTGGLVLGYVELLPAMGIAYLLYVAVLGARGQLEPRAVARLWLPAVLIVVVVLNGYLLTEIGFLKHQAATGLQNVTGPPLFGYIVVPSGLPGVVGLQTLPPGADAPHLNLTIALAAVLIIGALVGSVVSLRRGAGAAAVLIVEAGLGVLLVVRHNDFGLFKLSMYVQPFLAAMVAIWVSGTSRRWLRVGALGLLIALVVAELPNQRAYVNASRDPENAPHLSAADEIPAFHALVTKNPAPIVSVTENPVLIKLEAAAAGQRRVFFQSRNGFVHLLEEYSDQIGGSRHVAAVRGLRAQPWVLRSFDLRTADGAQNSFEEDTNAERSLKAGRCQLVLPSDSVVPFNRYSLPASSPDLVTMPCDAARNLLAFTSSALGQSFYLPLSRLNVSFFQPQSDPFFAGRAMVGFGRYALFRVLGPSAGERLVVEMTDTLNHDGANVLPPADAVGSARLALPLEGRGSARVFSPPLKPQIIAGAPYVMVDMGVNGKLPVTGRSGLQNIYGASVPTDPRYLTGYVRDISLVSAAQYASLHPPIALRRFPQDLEDPGLEYSGLYEDGWMGANGYVRLAGGPATDLLVEGEVPAGAGKRLELLVNGRRVMSRAILAGPLRVRVAVPASRSSRRIELRFAATIKLTPPDERPAAAHLTFLGLLPSRGQ